jgi:TolB protein
MPRFAAALAVALPIAALAQAPASAPAAAELPVRVIPNLGEGAEFYFSPDNKSLIGNAKRAGDTTHHVYTTTLDGTKIVKINDKGEDACSFYFPDGKHLLWTSTRDLADLPKGN